ncbi:MAG: M28 family peptidase, partial [Bacteroidaceae bacterium]|nr:M28 family peptidase [Bacteroidaceae bacterium]
MARLTAIFAALLLVPLAVFSQKYIERGYRTILSADGQVFVEMLASDSLQGRNAGDEGGRMAAEYIVSQLKEWGIRPLDRDGYLQPFAAGGCSMNNILAVIPGKSDEYVIVGAHYDHMGIGVAVGVFYSNVIAQVHDNAKLTAGGKVQVLASAGATPSDAVDTDAFNALIDENQSVADAESTIFAVSLSAAVGGTAGVGVATGVVVVTSVVKAILDGDVLSANEVDVAAT